MQPHSTDIDKLVAELTLDEKVLLTAGADMWATVPIERLGIPSVRVTDGPNGARGPTMTGEGWHSSVCVPCGTALGATWDPALVEEVGRLLGREARRKGCRVLLAPTVNIHRSPLAGRNFECYSEDPLLSGRIAAGFVRGVQAEGVATTVKHFAGNDAEFERNTISSEIDERTLREITLVPFELAVREGGALGIMTGYNRLNGVWCAEHDQLLAQILRGEWSFEGFVVSDWFAMGSAAGSAIAGLDLEMPGPGRFFGPALAEAVRKGEVEERYVDDQVRRLLSVWDRLGAFEDPAEAEPQSVDVPVDRALARRAASDAIVLLRNDGILPLKNPLKETTVALIGPNADRAQIMGGGSANFRPHYRTSPLQALRDALGDAVRFSPGCDIDRTSPLLGASDVTTPDGQPGWSVDVGGETHVAQDSRIIWMGDQAPVAGAFTAKARAVFTPSLTGPHRFKLVQAGRARVWVGGSVVLDGFADPPPPGDALFGLASAPMRAAVELTAGQPVDLEVEYSSEGSFLARGFILSCRRPLPEDMLGAAAALAASCDTAVVVVGTNADWESEGHDRDSMRLPGDQDELIRAVAKANPDTVVVVNTGAPVEMPWAGEVRAILQVWFGGQEMGNAIADVLLGAAEPGGRLPTTLPERLEHNPSFGNFPGENGKVRYGEGVFVGYRWYEARHLPVRFPFGHGLSYTTFEIGAPRMVDPRTAEVRVTNTGTRRGAEVVQCYVAPVGTPRLVRPPKELKAFAKVWLDAGESTTVTFALDERAFAYWDPGDPEWPGVRARFTSTIPFPPQAKDREATGGWRVEPGEYRLCIGRSSAAIAHTVTTTIG